MDSLTDGLAACLVSIVVTGILIPQILLIAFRKRLFDEPDGRKIHTAAVPRLGGIAFMPAIVFSVCVVIGVRLNVSGMDPYVGVGQRVMPLCFGLCAMMMMYLVGMADDLVGVRYRAKFVAQITVGLLLVGGGVCIDNLHGLLGLYEIPFAFGCLLTVLLTVFIVNAINLIDGIDGLASGLGAIAMGFYAVNFWLGGRWLYSMVAFAGLGTLVPFFYYNVFGKPAMGKKIFMGDTGALTIGLILAFLALETLGLPVRSRFSPDIIVVAFAPLAIPSLDVIRVFVHRLRRRHSPFLPDRTHIHHKLLALGIPQRQAMVAIVASSALTVVANLWMTYWMDTLSVMLIDLGVWAAGNYMLTRAVLARQRRLGVEDGYR